MLGGEINPLSPRMPNISAEHIVCVALGHAFPVVLLGGSTKSHSAGMIVARKKTFTGIHVSCYTLVELC